MTLIQRRKKGPRKKPAYAPYRSGLEKKLHQSSLKSCLYEPKASKVSYTEDHMYTPDFVHKKTPEVLLESKGRFRPGDTKKYKSIKKSLETTNQVLVFIFQKPEVPVLGAKTRKDGTTLSLGEWATTNGFLWYPANNIPLEVQLGSADVPWVVEQLNKRENS